MSTLERVLAWVLFGSYISSSQQVPLLPSGRARVRTTEQWQTMGNEKARHSIVMSPTIHAPTCSTRTSACQARQAHMTRVPGSRTPKAHVIRAFCKASILRRRQRRGCSGDLSRRRAARSICHRIYATAICMPIPIEAMNFGHGVRP